MLTCNLVSVVNGGSQPCCVRWCAHHPPLKAYCVVTQTRFSEKSSVIA